MDYSMDDSIEALATDLRSMYQGAARGLQKKSEDFFAGFQRRQATKKTLLSQGKITEGEYTQWTSNQLAVDRRWRALVQNMAEDLTNVNLFAADYINMALPGGFAHGANHASFDISKGLHMNLDFGLYDRATVERLALANPDLLPHPRVDIPKDLRWNKQRINKEINQGILQGESLDKVAKRVQVVTQSSYAVSKRNATTAMTAAHNAGRLETYTKAADMGINMRQEWLSTLDGRTRHSHRSLDGERVSVTEEFSNGCRYPGDPDGPAHEVYNCRCTTVAVIDDGRKIDPVHRRENTLDVDGKKKVIDDVKYEEWAKSKGGTPGIPVIDASKVITTANEAVAVEQITKLMQENDWFDQYRVMDLDGADLESAKTICNAYEEVFNKYPQLKKKLGGVRVVDLNPGTYAQCYIFGGGRVEVGRDFFSDYKTLVKSYTEDLGSGFHPKGTSVRGIITHEIGHAIDGFLTGRGTVIGDYTTTPYAKNGTVSSRLRAKVAQSTGVKFADMGSSVSVYATRNAREWFAEAFAEYIGSPTPRPVAANLGKRLDEILKEVKIDD